MYCAAYSRIPPPTTASLLLLLLSPASTTPVSWIRFTAPPSDWLKRIREGKKNRSKNRSQFREMDGWFLLVPLSTDAATISSPQVCVFGVDFMCINQMQGN